jgi:hypothetical protein
MAKPTTGPGYPGTVPTDARLERRQTKLRNELYEIGRRAGRGTERDGDSERRAEIEGELGASATEAEQIYQLGYGDGSDDGATKPGRRRSTTHRRSSSSRRSSAGRRVPRPVSTGYRQLAAPVRAQAANATRTLFLVLAVVGLYLLLTTAEALPTAVRGLFDAPSRGLRWLAHPNRSIPYAPGYRP